MALERAGKKDDEYFKELYGLFRYKDLSWRISFLENFILKIFAWILNYDKTMKTNDLKFEVLDLQQSHVTSIQKLFDF